MHLDRFTPVSVISSAVIGSTSYGFLLTAQWLGRRAWELFYMLSVLSSSTINLTEEGSSGLGQDTPSLIPSLGW